MSSSARRAGVGTRPYVLLQGRPLWSAAILRGRRPAIRRGALPHFRGPRRSPAATAAGSVGKGAAAEGVSFAACGEAKDLELAATLSRYAPSATGNCSLLRRKYRWTASSLFFRSAQFSVALLPGAPRFYSTPFPGKKKEG